ncbi:HD domain-containing protein [bacterium]|nr:HD domain-containing protein [bacterium]
MESKKQNKKARKFLENNNEENKPSKIDQIQTSAFPEEVTNTNTKSSEVKQDESIFDSAFSPKVSDQSKCDEDDLDHIESQPFLQQRLVENDPESETFKNCSNKADRQEMFLPVSGFVWLYPEEIQVINHPAFQRLAKINQLGQTYLVYRGATHKRFEHAIGTVKIVQRMMDAVKQNTRKAQKHHRTIGRFISGKSTNDPYTNAMVQLNPKLEGERRFIRLGALLHDIGHIAAGHTLEDELGLLGRHDEFERLKLIFDYPDYKDKDELTLRERVDKEYSKFMPEDLRKNNLTPSDLVMLLILKPLNSNHSTYESKNNNQDLKKKETFLIKSNEIRLNVCRDMIGNTICADL